MDKKGMTARALAANKEQWAVVAILKEAEAKQEQPAAAAEEGDQPRLVP